jgi:multisubunit Na+/H+ antiporter MnhF subunit
LLYFQPVIAFVTARAAIGETMEIRGSNFTGITEVKFGQLPATSFTVLSATNLQAVVPPNAVTGKLTMLVLAIRYDSSMYFEGALLMVLFGFVGSVALAKFLLRGEVIE